MKMYDPALKTVWVFALMLTWNSLSLSAEKLEVRLKSGKKQVMTVLKVVDNGIKIKVGQGEAFMAWGKFAPVSLYDIQSRFMKGAKPELWIKLGDFCVKHKLLKQARKCYETAKKKDPKLEARVKEKLAALRGEKLEGTISLKLKKRQLDSALASLGRKAKIKIKIDSALAEAIHKAPRKERPVVNYEAENVTFEVALESIIKPFKMQYIDTPEGIVVYSRKLGAGEDTTKIFVDTLATGAIEDRLKAAAILAQVKAEAALPDLCAATKQPNAMVRRAAIIALRAFRDPQADEALMAALKDPIYGNRVAAAYSLTTRPSASNLDQALIECMESKYGTDANICGQIFARLGTPESLQYIKESLSPKKFKVKDHWARRYLIRALGQQGDMDAIPLLRQWLFHRDAAYFREAPLALAALNDRASIPSVISSIEKHKKDWTAVYECCRALVRFGGSRANAAVFSTIDNREKLNEKTTLINFFREAAPCEQIEDGLLPFLEHEKESMVRAASETLGYVGSEKSIGPLIATMEKHPKKWWVNNPLRQLTKQNFGYDLKKWKEWWEKAKAEFKVKR